VEIFVDLRQLFCAFFSSFTFKTSLWQIKKTKKVNLKGGLLLPIKQRVKEWQEKAENLTDLEEILVATLIVDWHLLTRKQGKEWPEKVERLPVAESNSGTMFNKMPELLRHFVKSVLLTANTALQLLGCCRAGFMQKLN
jgi:predicted metallo-beta-lactamase superfamily hydrolase